MTDTPKRRLLLAQDMKTREWQVTDVDGKRVPGVPMFKTIQLAKQFAWVNLGTIPHVPLAGAVPFDPAIETHAALARIEARNSRNQGAEIIAVAAGHYLVRRCKFGTEFKVKWQHRPTHVTARNDTEYFDSTAAPPGAAPEPVDANTTIG